MKLILASAGLYTDEIATEMARLVGKPNEEINIAVISEAVKVEFGDRREWYFNELEKIKKYTGGKIDFIDLQANDLETVKTNIAFADVVYMQGGNPDYLMHVLAKTGFDKLLKELLQTKVYIGSSAGSMVVGKRIKSARYRAEREERENYGVTDYLNWVSFAIAPHINSPVFPDHSAKHTKEIIEPTEGTVYALEDTQAVVVEGDKISFVGGEALQIN